MKFSKSASALVVALALAVLPFGAGVASAQAVTSSTYTYTPQGVIASSTAGTALYSSTPVYAVTSSTATQSSTMQNCLNLPQDLYEGLSDPTMDGQVIALQTFLKAQGYFMYDITGYFGPITKAAAVQYQAAHGVPTTGYVGPLPRASIQGVTCNEQNQPALPGSPAAPVTSVQFNSTPSQNANAPRITSVSPYYGPVGTTVTVTGTNFTNDNNVRFDVGAVQHVGSIVTATTTSNTPLTESLTFTVPSSVGAACAYGTNCVLPLYQKLLVPGNYNIQIENANGLSNVFFFSVMAGNVTSATTTTGTTTSSASTSSSSATSTTPATNGPVIAGVNGPSELGIGQTGTWTVQVGDPTSPIDTTIANGAITYSVTWGDEGQPNASTTLPSSNTFQSRTASFSHTYSQAGTYNLIFAVSYSDGRTSSIVKSVGITSSGWVYGGY